MKSNGTPSNGSGNGNGRGTLKLPSQFKPLPLIAKHQRSKPHPPSTSTRRRISTSTFFSLNLVPPIPIDGNFDIIEELSSNKEKYVGKEQLTMYDIPTYLLTDIDRIRALVNKKSGHRVGTHPTLCAAISHGIHILSSSDIVKSLKATKESIDLCSAEGVNILEIDELSSWYRGFSIQIPNIYGSGSRSRQNICMPEFLKQAIGGFSSELGVAASMSMVLSIMVGLINQESVLHTAEMQQCLNIFYGRIDLKRVVCQAWLDRLKLAASKSASTTPLFGVTSTGLPQSILQ